MRLYLIRHGKAERHSADGSDELRELTKRGRRQAEWLGRRLGESGAPERILSSPAARAVQTATLIADRLGLGVELADQIGLGAGPSDIIDFVSTLSHSGPIALVGHNPTFSAAADIMVHGPSAAHALELRTGQAAVLDLVKPGDPLGGARLVELLRMEE
jgi:phosphohistidine phosphatase